MSRSDATGTTRDHLAGYRGSLGRQVEELIRRNPRALAMDSLLLITTGFFAVLATKAWNSVSLPLLAAFGISVPFSWPLVIAALPLAGLLYFGWRSSRAFATAQLVTIVLTLIADRAGLLPV